MPLIYVPKLYETGPSIVLNSPKMLKIVDMIFLIMYTNKARSGA